MGDYKYIVFVEPLDGVLNIEKIIKITNGEKMEFVIDNQMTLEKVLDSFGEDGQKIYNILTNEKSGRGMRLVVDTVDDIVIPEGIYAIFINEEKLHREWAERIGNTAVFPPYHMNPNKILI